MGEQIPCICDSCLLIKTTQGGGRYLDHYVPQTWDICDQLQIILVNSFPNNIGSSSVYAFTTQTRICYTYNFTYKETPYSIILVSELSCPLIFLKYLQEMKVSIESNVERNNDIDPEARMTLIWSTIQSWHFIDKCEAVVTFSSVPFHAILNLSFSQFSPFNYFSADTDYFFIWRSVLTGKRILILANGATPKNITYATFGLASLSGIFPYREKILLSQNSQDPRLSDKEAISDYKIICTQEIPICCTNSDFDVIISIQVNKAQNDICKQLIQARNQRLHDIVSFFLNRNLIVDPYSDFLEKDFAEDYTDMITPQTMQKIMDEEQFQEFVHTKTFKSWRRNNIFNDEFRDIFLSTLPEIPLVNKTKEELYKCVNFLDIIKEHYSSDVHVISVIKRHKKIIKRLLNGEKIEIKKQPPVVLSKFQLNFSSDET